MEQDNNGRWYITKDERLLINKNIASFIFSEAEKTGITSIILLAPPVIKILIP
jgi:hypothetical protein